MMTRQSLSKIRGSDVDERADIIKQPFV